MWDLDPKIWDKRNWRGGNTLGEALMEVPKHWGWKQVSMFEIPIQPVSNNFTISEYFRRSFRIGNLHVADVIPCYTFSERLRFIF